MFVDCHLHTRRTDGVPRPGTQDTYATPEELIAMMDRTGVDKGILLPGCSPECRNLYTSSEDVLEICAKYPQRFYCFCNLDPRMGGNDDSTDFSHYLNFYRERGCRGVGELTCNLEFDDPQVRNLLAHVEKSALPLIFHIGPQKYNCYGLIDRLGLPGLEKALKDFPSLTFIGHSQAFWAEIGADVTEESRRGYPTGPVTPGRVPELLDRYPNLWCGWDAGSGYNALTRAPEYGYGFFEKYRDRILFGTDICSPKNNHLHAAYLRQCRAAGNISAEAFENVSWRNANRLFNLGL